MFFFIFLYQHILNHTTFTKDRNIVFLILYICYSLFLKPDINEGVCVSVQVTHFHLTFSSCIPVKCPDRFVKHAQYPNISFDLNGTGSSCFRIKQASDIGQKSNWLLENIRLCHVFVNLLNIHLFEYSASIT